MRPASSQEIAGPPAPIHPCPASAESRSFASRLLQSVCIPAKRLSASARILFPIVRRRLCLQPCTSWLQPRPVRRKDSWICPRRQTLESPTTTEEDRQLL